MATDAEQNIVWRWNSDAFGATKADRDPDGDGKKVAINLRFPGQYYDRESGLYYNHHRDYDSVIGRYVQSDPIGLQGGLNTYAYVGGNPLMYIDPYGLMQACYRPLRAVPFAVIGTEGDKALNTVIGHEHIFFDDGTDVGFGRDGIHFVVQIV